MLRLKHTEKTIMRISSADHQVPPENKYSSRSMPVRAVNFARLVALTVGCFLACASIANISWAQLNASEQVQRSYT